MRALDELHKHPEFGLEAESSAFIDATEWNKGYSFEAAQAMKGFAISLWIQSLYATADPKNNCKSNKYDCFIHSCGWIIYIIKC